MPYSISHVSLEQAKKAKLYPEINYVVWVLVLDYITPVDSESFLLA